MKKHLYFMATACLLHVSSYAQNQNPPTGERRGKISFGGGTTMPNSKFKNEAFAAPATTLSASLAASLFGNQSLSFGLTANGDYFFANKFQNTAFPSPFQVVGQTGNALTDIKNTNSKNQSGYKFEAGPQATFKLAPQFELSPMVTVGYLKFNQEGFSLNQASATANPYTLVKQNKISADGFVVTPRLRLNYFLSSIGFYLESNYALGPSFTNTKSTFSPQGAPNASGEYTVRQLEGGTSKTTNEKTNLNTLGLHAGLAFKLGKNSGSGGNSKSQNTDKVKFKAGAELSDKVNVAPPGNDMIEEVLGKLIETTDRSQLNQHNYIFAKDGKFFYSKMSDKKLKEIFKKAPLNNGSSKAQVPCPPLGEADRKCKLINNTYCMCEMKSEKTESPKL